MYILQLHLNSIFIHWYDRDLYMFNSNFKSVLLFWLIELKSPYYEKISDEISCLLPFRIEKNNDIIWYGCFSLVKRIMLRWQQMFYMIIMLTELEGRKNNIFRLYLVITSSVTTTLILSIHFSSLSHYCIYLPIYLSIMSP